MQLNEIDEFALIDQWHEMLDDATHPKVLLGIGDDAACLDDLHKPVFSCDALIENIHFRREWTTARQLGCKAMAVNISDIAAMGAKPVAVTVSLGLPTQISTDWVSELYCGFADMAKKFRFAIVGGDTVRSEQIMINIAIIGEPICRNVVRRDGARDGDAILLTGFTGESAAGLALLQWGKNHANNQHCIARHLQPVPRVAEMQAALECAELALHAAIDISDGISGDAAHIARRSGVDLSIDVAKIPLSAPCRNVAKILNEDALRWALSGGEDYELLLCVAADKAEQIIDHILAQTGTVVHRIGVCEKASQTTAQARFHRSEKVVEIANSWRHFG